MFCKNCGAKLPDNATFCSNCGTAVGGAQPTQAQPTVARPAVGQTAPQQPMPSQPYQGYQAAPGAATATAGGGSSKTKFVIIALVAVLAALAAFFVLRATACSAGGILGSSGISGKPGEVLDHTPAEIASMLDGLEEYGSDDGVFYLSSDKIAELVDGTEEDLTNLDFESLGIDALSDYKGEYAVGFVDASGNSLSKEDLAAGEEPAAMVYLGVDDAESCTAKEYASKVKSSGFSYDRVVSIDLLAFVSMYGGDDLGADGAQMAVFETGDAAGVSFAVQQGSTQIDMYAVGDSSALGDVGSLLDEMEELESYASILSEDVVYYE